MKRIKRVSYVKSGNDVYRKDKTVLKLVEKDCYIVYNYKWSTKYNEWLPTKGTALFDGKDVHDVGIVHMSNDVERYMQLLVEYNGFLEMKPDENNRDIDADDACLLKLVFNKMGENRERK